MPSKPALQIGDIVGALTEMISLHRPSSKTYQMLDRIAVQTAAASGFASADPISVIFGEFGNVIFPFEKMGAITTLDLFGLDELIIFAFYWVNRNRYRSAVDIGANLGIHSILMAKCGWTVRSFEPDPQHASGLRRNLELNGIGTVELVEAAVSDRAGTLEFIRVLGNTTSSHLAGAKQNAYGDLDRFPVRVEGISTIIPAADLIKLDAEGQERQIILGTSPEHWADTDMMLEVGSEQNAEAIFSHLRTIQVAAFAQKIGWQRVTSLSEMPTTYKDGSLFLTRRQCMPWS